MLAEGPTEGAERSRHICQLCARLLGVTGAGISLVTAAGNRGVVCATDEVSARIEDLQFTLGERLGLPTPALVAFLAGAMCVIGALTAGLVSTYGNATDWQAVQVVRIEWLLGAISAFAAGCLLKPRR